MVAGWDKKARKHFRDILISLQAALDALADLTALTLTGLVSNLTVGRAQFTAIENWLTKPLPKIAFVVSPADHHLRNLYERLHPLVHPSGSDRG